MRYAFTLIELLIVITIITVLAGLLLPALGTVRSSAQGLQCANNLRTLQMANIAYASAWDGYFAPAYVRNAAGVDVWRQWDHNVDLAALLWSEKRDASGNSPPPPRTMLCPVARNYQPSMYWDSFLSYASNIGWHQWAPIPNYIAGYRESRGQLSDVMAFADGLDSRAVASQAAAYWTGTTPAPEGYYRPGAVAYRHRGRARVVMYDGHVEILGVVNLAVSASGPPWTNN